MPFYKNLRKEKSKEFAERAIDRLLDLRKQIKEEVPQRTLKETLLLATWNIRDFDSNKWKHGPRLDESLYYIAEVISAFDMVAVQEVNEDLGPLKKVMNSLGSNWDYIVTDVTDHDLGGNGERLAFVFDKRKVFFRGIAGEIVLPKSKTIKGDPVKFKLPKKHEIKFTKDTSLTLPDGNVVQIEKDQSMILPDKAHKIHLEEGQPLIKHKQFARTPFLVAFQSGWFKFSLCTVHIFYGEKYGLKYRRRVKEIKAIASYLADAADKIREKSKTGENFIILGDFNIVDEEDDTMKALKKYGFTLPPNLFKSNVKETAFYDQIAFMVKENELQMGPNGDKNNGVFKFYESVFRESDYEIYHDLMVNTKIRDFDDKENPRDEAGKKEYYKDDWRTWQMSDHYPLWVELKIDFSNDYLNRIKTEITATD